MAVAGDARKANSPNSSRHKPVARLAAARIRAALARPPTHHTTPTFSAPNTREKAKRKARASWG